MDSFSLYCIFKYLTKEEYKNNSYSYFFYDNLLEKSKKDRKIYHTKRYFFMLKFIYEKYHLLIFIIYLLKEIFCYNTLYYF